MNIFVECIVSLLIVISGGFMLIGSVGMIKLPDLMSRLHGPTKATTLGIGSVLLASVIFFSVAGTLSIHEVLITFFLFLTAPITAHFIAKAWMHQTGEKVRRELPDTGRDCGWSTFDPQPGAAESDVAKERG